MPLSDVAIKKAKPATKPQKMPDADGLYLLVAVSGGKLWRYDYRFGGKRKTLSYGAYPDLSLARARECHGDARKLLASGVDPAASKQADKLARQIAAVSSFEAVAREWFAKHQPSWAKSHSEKVIRRLEKDVFPWMGNRPISEITAPELLATIRRTESRGALDTAHRALQNCGQVFRYAVATGRAERDPSGDLRGALPPARTKHYASIVDPQGVAELLRAMDGFKGTLVVQCALKLAPLVFTRPGELRKAEWSEIDLEKGEWNIPAERMKGWLRKGITTPHLVPLSSQSLAILKELHALTGHRRYVFLGRDPQKPMSEAAINAALRRMGYDTKEDITGHGFRAMARTILHEELDIERDVIEHQLAHSVPDALGTAYNRTKFIKDRRSMMQVWADYLDKLKSGADVISFPARTA
ncbi:phage integrase central domain-containing protein [Silvimonas sp.]|uniref:tyrosine-type recombinase/integrase n=1 Tax=Silvimonas sp. TaxID=2650811 RepID=UPI0028495231|nr:integrase arm-type DNA-binding domain-containing protein [Silvimonas sp.]MDR3429997.1 integrase arm-type DNA-binding domain-containing protein [Silvimonas sp.]